MLSIISFGSNLDQMDEIEVSWKRMALTEEEQEVVDIGEDLATEAEHHKFHVVGSMCTLDHSIIKLCSG